MPKIVKQNGGSKKKVSSENVVDRIKPIGFDRSSGIKIVLYGRSGTGKTTLWATFPKPILAIVCSGGRNPGELRSIDTAEYRKTIKQVAIENSGEIKELVDFQNETDEFATVVLDHGTGLQDRTLAEVLGIDELPAQASWGMARQQDWGQCALQMKEMFRAIISLECNIVIVAQEKEFNVDSDSDLLTPYVGSALMPSVAGWLNPAADYVCQTFVRQKTREVRVKMNGKETTTTQKVKGQVEYCLRTGPSDVYTTKFRVPRGTVLPEIIVDPSFDKIKALLHGG